MPKKNIVNCVVKVESAIFNEYLNTDTPTDCSRRLVAFIESNYETQPSLAVQVAPAVSPHSSPVYMEIDIDAYIKVRRLLLTPQGL
ncbi:MAG: hypothetical protein R3Y11_12775, partial [Pseudomonadota bacterium]